MTLNPTPHTPRQQRVSHAADVPLLAAALREIAAAEATETARADIADRERHICAPATGADHATVRTFHALANASGRHRPTHREGHRPVIFTEGEAWAVHTRALADDQDPLTEPAREHTLPPQTPAARRALPEPGSHDEDPPRPAR
ncbi:hypothetical protein CTZ27_30035 [Streptomyces griseocarneus]|nr:hypothetical protein CTZ27_30035 [Streptomyces griseocarneus]